jgi:hypothetical protein
VELLNSAFLTLFLHMFRGTLLSSPAGDLWFNLLVLTSLFQRHTFNQRMGWYPILSFNCLCKLQSPLLAYYCLHCVWKGLVLSCQPDVHSVPNIWTTQSHIKPYKLICSICSESRQGETLCPNSAHCANCPETCAYSGSRYPVFLHDKALKNWGWLKRLSGA